MKKPVAIISACAICCIGIIGIIALNTPKKAEVYISDIIPEKSEEELILDSDLIVTGSVAKILPSKWSNEDLSRGENIQNILQTDIVVNVDNILSGDCGNTVTVRIDKGEDEKTVVHSDGYPDFEKNERVLLFLARDDSDVATDEDYYVLTGMKQGKYVLAENSDAKSTQVGATYQNRDNAAEISNLEIPDLQEKIIAVENANQNYRSEKEARQEEVKENNKQYFTDLE